MGLEPLDHGDYSVGSRGLESWQWLVCTAEMAGPNMDGLKHVQPSLGQCPNLEVHWTTSGSSLCI